jgi:hypothetical protein
MEKMLLFGEKPLIFAPKVYLSGSWDFPEVEAQPHHSLALTLNVY